MSDDPPRYVQLDFEGFKDTVTSCLSAAFEQAFLEAGATDPRYWAIARDKLAILLWELWNATVERA